MNDKPTFIICVLVIAFFLALTACIASEPTPSPVVITATREVVYVVVTNTSTPAPPLIPTVTKTNRPTRTPTNTIHPTSTRIPTSTSSPIPILLTPFATPLSRDISIYPISDVAIEPENVSTIRELARWGKGEIRELAFSPDGSMMVTVTSLGVYFYDTTNFDLITFTQIDIPVGAVALSKDLEYVAIGTSYGQVWIWETETGKVKQNFTISDQRIIGLAISPDSRSIYSSSWDDSYYSDSDRKSFIWDIETASKIGQLDFGFDKMVFSEDGQTAAADFYGIWVWPVKQPEKVISFNPSQENGDAEISSFALSYDGTMVAIGTMFQVRVQVWDVASTEIKYDFYIEQQANAHKPENARAKLLYRSGPGDLIVTGLAFSRDNQRLAVTTAFGVLEERNLASNGTLLLRDTTYAGNLLYSPNDRILANWEYSAQFREPTTGKLIGALGNHVGSIVSMDFSPDGKEIAVGSADHNIWLRRSTDGAIIRTFKGHRSTVADLEYSQDGQYIISGSPDTTARLWTVSGGSVEILGEPIDWVGSVGISLDNQYAAFASFDNYTQFVNLENNTIIKTGWSHLDLAFSPTEQIFAIGLPWENIGVYEIPGFEQKRAISTGFYVDNLEFSEDGTLIAASDSWDKLMVWSFETNTYVLKINKDTGGISDFAISPDNRIFVFGNDMGIEIWSLENGELLDSYRFNDHVRAIDFSPDGHLLAIGLADGTISIWGIAP